MIKPNDKKKIFRQVCLCWILWISQAAYAELDPTVCHPLTECKSLCEQHKGNEYADFVIRGKNCICPACNTLKIK